MFLKEGKFEGQLNQPGVRPWHADTSRKDGINAEFKSPDGMSATVHLYQDYQINRPLLAVNVTGRDGKKHTVAFLLNSEGEVIRFSYGG